MATGVIDIGTNTLLLLIVDADLRPIFDLCRFGRLGAGLDASGHLAPEAIARSLAICREYRAVMDEHGVGPPTVVGTQALREATNAADFTVPAEQILGAPIEVITGAREAELAFLSVGRTFPELASRPYVVVDVGGGSTEIITTDGVRITSAVSLPIGAVRLTDRHGQPPACIDPLTRDIDEHLATIELPFRVPIVGTSGTATTMAAVAKRLPVHDSARVTGVRLSAGLVTGLYDLIMGASLAARRAMPGMEPERADVIHAGVAIYQRLVVRMSAPFMITADRGVRWGLAFERYACSAGAR